MVQLSAMKHVKGQAPLSVVVAIIGGLALAGVIFTEDLRGLTEVKDKKETEEKENRRTSPRAEMRASAVFSAEPVTPSTEAAKMAFDASGCSVNKGYWAYDESKKLPYTDQTCPHIDRQDSCQRNGRPDSDYLFDPVAMPEKLRGKRIMFVGDSLQLGQ
ncbi:hypothetical protein GUJ93_ZPchr0003g17224 [Zizania palustris]|uniref:Trichome birefringence-like N-terminal domain-containing protein n=1 Tax=Zizania palustris TaxID=103762 RepID=A0A8J5VET6_ZIZPA|nr:hypothetical protein GUJ93_ZPchr0003g17224 [Zizania palustris]